MEISSLNYKLSDSSNLIQVDRQQKSEVNKILVDQKILNFSMTSTDSDSSTISEKNISTGGSDSIQKITRRVQLTILEDISPYAQIVKSSDFENKEDTFIGKKTGKGSITWLNGVKYVGEFLNNEEDGKGTFFEPNGIICEGFFLDGVFTQEIITLQDNKGKFVGIFVGGTGYGTFFRADGGIYKGDFVSFQFHGRRGIYLGV